MKTQLFKTLIIQVIFFLPLILSSCNDDKADSVDPKKKEAAEKIMDFREEFAFIDQFLNSTLIEFPSNEGGRVAHVQHIISRIKETAPCVDPVEEELEGGSMKITIDFGDGCTADENIVMAGKVILIFSFNESTIEFATEFINYQEIYDNENKTAVVSGTSSGSFTINLETSVFSQVISQDLTILDADNHQGTFSSIQKNETTETGLSVTEFTSSGQLPDGNTFDLTVTKPLLFDFTCSNTGLPVKGTEMLVFNEDRILIDYGNGACDDAYTIK